MHSDKPDSFSARQISASAEGVKLSFHAGAAENLPLTRRGVLDQWKSNDEFCSVFSKSLASVPMDAFFWETPALHDNTLDLPFECVLTPSPPLAQQNANPQPFAAYIGPPCTRDVVSFANMRGDADLVVPRDTGGATDYAHLAAFLRSADAAQIRTLWQHVGETCELWLTKDKPFWVSTSGMGVAWLHVRVESSPKYYSHRPYCQVT